MNRLPLLILLLSLLVLPLTGCPRATTPDEDTTSRAARLQSIQQFAQAPEVLAAVALRPDGVEAYSDMIRALSATDPELLEIWDDIDAVMDQLPSLARDEHTYILLTTRGHEDFFRAALLGLPTKEEEWPNFLNVRVLFPTDSPSQLMTELQPLLDDEPRGTTLAFPGPGFVRLEIAIEINEPDDAAAARWLGGLGLEHVQAPSAAELRATPAYSAFIDEENIASAWMRLESLTYAGLLEMATTFGDQYAQVGPMGKPRFFLEGIPRLSEAAIVSDAMLAEVEDFALVLRSGDGLITTADFVASRTARGVTSQASTSPISVAGFEAKDAFLTFEWQGQLTQPEGRRDNPLWLDLLGGADDDFMGEGRGAGMGGMPGGFVSTDLTGGFESSMASLLSFLQTPSTTISHRTGGQEGITNPRAVALEAFPADSGFFPVGAALVAVYPNTPNYRSTLESLLQFAEDAIPLPFDARLAERDDGFLEVHITLGPTLDQVFLSRLPPRLLDGLSISADMDSLREIIGMVPGVERLRDLDFLHLRARSEDGYYAFRMTLASPEAQLPPSFDAGDGPLQNPNQRCRTEMAAASYEHLRDLRTDAPGHVARWRAAVEARAGECVGSDRRLASFVNERLQLAEDIASRVP